MRREGRRSREGNAGTHHRDDTMDSSGGNPKLRRAISRWPDDELEGEQRGKGAEALGYL
jgi:hypothetical protein